MNGISVIIPCYNREQYICECIESVLLQKTDFPVEIIVADDGSMDKSPDIVRTFCAKQYENKTVILIDKPAGCKTQGPGAARNRGINAAQGKYIAFLDSDDLYLPGHLQRCYDYLETYPETNVVIEQTFVQNGDKVAGRWHQPYPDKEFVSHRNLFVHGCFHTNAWMFRKSVFESAGLFDEDLIMSEDFDLWNRIFESGERMKILDGNGSIIREHSGRSMRSVRKCVETGFTATQKAVKRFPYPRNWIRERYAVLEFQLFKTDITARHYGSALFRLCKMFYLAPVKCVKRIFGKEF